MKNLALLKFIISSICCIGQPDPQLFQNWYLSYVQGSDLSDGYSVSGIEPPISPTLIISDNFTFTGVGACNTFEGSFNSPDSYNWETLQFSQSSIDCKIPILNYFETSYFSFLPSVGNYEIMPITGGLQLTMANPIFGYAVFQNFALSSIDFDLTDVAVYPIPTKNKIIIDQKNLKISRIKVINLYGKIVKEINSGFETVDVSDLSSGQYILQIKTEIGMINKKIIKE